MYMFSRLILTTTMCSSTTTTSTTRGTTLPFAVVLAVYIPLRVVVLPFVQVVALYTSTTTLPFVVSTHCTTTSTTHSTTAMHAVTTCLPPVV